MYYRLLLIFGILLITACSEESQEIQKPEVTISEVEARLNKLASMDYDYDQAEEIHQYLDSLKRARFHPVTEDTSVLFVHFGAGETVEWRGSFNSWGNDTTPKAFGTQIGNSKIWTWKTNFPKDARSDYKIVVNGDRWMEDPYNLNRQFGGGGFNSELRMPDYADDPITLYRLGIERGNLSENTLILSKVTASRHNYRVYTPFNYENLEPLPVIYVTDGHDYINNAMGNMITVLDNLIANGSIEPVIAVFVDPRLPENSSVNRRGIYLPINEEYLRFFTDELIPEIEANYKVRNTASDRAILGTSLGGINSTYFTFERPDVFAKSAIQSPAYWYKRAIYAVVEESEAKPENIQIFMSIGTINDGLEDALEMKDLMEAKGFEINFLKVNSGHSWGAWTNQLDDVLIQFFGK